jgi:glycosyltransferase involved in cell wall biosynthesis
MASRTLFWLYRPAAPSVRAQSIQVVNAAHAMAVRGHRVTLCVQPPKGARPSGVEILDAYGLSPVRGFELVVLPSGGTAASLAFRLAYLAWIARSPNGIAIARSKRYADAALRWLGSRARVVLEQHEVDSRLAAERGEDPVPIHALEARVLRRAIGVIANCPGTLELLRESHPSMPPAVALHNATHASRIRRPAGPGDDVGYVGSVLPGKDIDTLARAADRTRQRIVIVGPRSPAQAEVLAGSRLGSEDPVAHRSVPDRLARFRTLVLPLGTSLFGSRLTSPLKLWDYLASGRPIAAADTPALRDAAPEGSVAWWTPGDPASLALALDRLDRDEALRASVVAAARVRTWDDRAAELEAFLADIAP